MNNFDMAYAVMSALRGEARMLENGGVGVFLVKASPSTLRKLADRIEDEFKIVPGKYDQTISTKGAKLASEAKKKYLKGFRLEGNRWIRS